MGTQVKTLKPYPHATQSVIILWAGKDVSTLKVNPKHELDMHKLVEDAKMDWQEVIWAQILSIDADKWDELSTVKGAPEAAPPGLSYAPDDDFDTADHTPFEHKDLEPEQRAQAPQQFRLSGQGDWTPQIFSPIAKAGSEQDSPSEPYSPYSPDYGSGLDHRPLPPDTTPHEAQDAIEQRENEDDRDEECYLAQIMAGLSTDTREAFDDRKFQPVFHAEMNEKWAGREQPSDTGDRYSRALAHSAFLCAEMPAVYTAADAKQSALLLRKHHDRNQFIMEVEIPYTFLSEEVQEELGREPGPDEIVLLELDKKTHGQRFKIERELPELTPADMITFAKEIEAAMAKEWASWADHSTFQPRLRSMATNTIDARWLHKFKIVDGKKVVKSRLCVRGFKDTQGDAVTTSASTAARWTQRLVCSVAANHGWKISIADVATAFLRGMTFDEQAKLTGEPLREVCLNPPKGSWKFLSTFDVMKGCSEATHVLQLVKGVYGLKDAPRAWRIKLDILLRAIGAIPMKSDPCLYMWHTARGKLECIASTHVDDLKIAGGDAIVARILTAMEKEVGVLKKAVGDFEHCGIMHRQLPNGDVTIHQNHYTPQLNALSIPGDTNLEALCCPTDHAAYMSLLGAVAWMVNTRADVAIFVGALQRVAKNPRIIDMKRLNTVLKFMKKHQVITLFRKLTLPIKLIAISDSAFKRQDESPLACRGSMIALCEDRSDNIGGHLQVIDYQSQKQKRVTRSTYGAELHGLADTMEAARRIACAFTEVYTGARTFDTLCKIEDEGRYHFPIEACLDAKSVYESIRVPDLKTPAEASLINILGQMREHMSTGRIRVLHWIDTRDMLADGLNKGAISRKAILRALIHGTWRTEHDFVSVKSSDVSYSDNIIAASASAVERD